MIVINGNGYNSLREVYSRGEIDENSPVLCSGGSAYFDENSNLISVDSKRIISENDLENFVGKWGALKSGQTVKRLVL